MNNFIKFPESPSLIRLSPQIESDPVMNEDQVKVFLEESVFVEEKIVGSLLGISFDSSKKLVIQNKFSVLGDYEISQINGLKEWLRVYTYIVKDVMKKNYVLFGVWNKRSSSLKNPFIAVDIYDKNRKEFVSVRERDAMSDYMSIDKPNFVGSDKFDTERLSNLAKRINKIGKKNLKWDTVDEKPPAEGLYIRGYDNITRAKLLSPRGKGDVQSVGDGTIGCVVKYNL